MSLKLVKARETRQLLKPTMQRLAEDTRTKQGYRETSELEFSVEIERALKSHFAPSSKQRIGRLAGSLVPFVFFGFIASVLIVQIGPQLDINRWHGWHGLLNPLIFAVVCSIVGSILFNFGKAFHRDLLLFRREKVARDAQYLEVVRQGLERPQRLRTYWSKGGIDDAPEGAALLLFSGLVPSEAQKVLSIRVSSEEDLRERVGEILRVWPELNVYYHAQDHFRSRSEALRFDQGAD